MRPPSGALAPRAPGRRRDRALRREAAARRPRRRQRRRPAGQAPGRRASGVGGRRGRLRRGGPRARRAGGREGRCLEPRPAPRRPLPAVRRQPLRRRGVARGAHGDRGRRRCAASHGAGAPARRPPGHDVPGQGLDAGPAGQLADVGVAGPPGLRAARARREARAGRAVRAADAADLRTVVRLAEETSDRIQGSRLRVRAPLYPILLSAAMLERHGLAAGEPRGWLVEARRP